MAWLAVAIAAFFFVLTRLLQRREVIAGSVYAPLYLALGVGFLTIAIPLKLGGHWNTLGWIIEAGALVLGCASQPKLAAAMAWSCVPSRSELRG